MKVLVGNITSSCVVLEIIVKLSIFAFLNGGFFPAECSLLLFVSLVLSTDPSASVVSVGGCSPAYHNAAVCTT